MKIKLVQVFLVLCLVLLASMTNPPKLAASCSGDQCDCQVDGAMCRDGCPPIGNPSHNSCISGCNQAETHCSVCCCCDYPGCPIYC
jgi:hypothetical protein